MKDIKWAVLGTGVIANEMAQALIKKERAYIQLRTGHIRKPLNLQKNTILTKCMRI